MGLAINARAMSTILLRRLLITYAAGAHKTKVMMVVRPATIRLLMKARTHNGRSKTSRYHLKEKASKGQLKCSLSKNEVIKRIKIGDSKITRVMTKAMLKPRRLRSIFANVFPHCFLMVSDIHEFYRKVFAPLNRRPWRYMINRVKIRITIPIAEP